MTTYLQLATVPSADTPSTCIYVHHDKCHYVFGRIAEGSQRAFTSRKISFAGVTQIFLSGAVGWDQVGGLTGFLLSIAGAVTASAENTKKEKKEKKGAKSIGSMVHNGINLHASDNISHLMASQRTIIFRQPIRVSINELRGDPRATEPATNDPDWEDGMLRVWKVPTVRERSSSPRKRRRLSPTDQADGAENGQEAETVPDEQYKEAQSLSDPEVADLIVSKLLWGGDNKGPQLLEEEIGNLEPNDTALIMENGVYRLYKGPYSHSGEEVPNPKEKVWIVGKRKPEGSHSRTWDLRQIPLPKTSYSQTSMSYVVKTYERRGKFDRAAAEALGVERLVFKHLINGEQVKGKDGATITPDMVMGDPIPGRGFAVADIAGPDFIESFMQRPEWTNKEIMAHVTVMYWILGTGLSSHPQIQKFMQDRPDIRHVICAPDTCPNMIANPGPAELQVRSRRIDADRFPIPSYDNAVKVPAPASGSHIHFGRAGSKVQLMPRLVHDAAAPVPFTDLVTPFNSVPSDIMALAAEAKTRATDPTLLAQVEEDEKDIPNRDAEIVALGTGSSMPSKYRNVSGTLILVPGVGNYLLDCGEGSIGQIRRLFGPERTAQILRDLKCVVVSHIHADHHLGAISVFRAWYEQALEDGNTANLAVSCIKPYQGMIQEQAQVEDFGFHRLRFPNCSHSHNITLDHAGVGELADDGLGGTFGLKAIRRVHVPHCWMSQGTELELTSGLRIAYSGDCRPSSDFARAFRGAHLLVHESTFADDLQADARAKMHSTISEALGVAKEMQARRVLLTHFSQRYVKRESLKWDAAPVGAEAGVDMAVLLAYDFMTVKLGEFRQAACYLPALQKLMEYMNNGAEE